MLRAAARRLSSLSSSSSSSSSPYSSLRPNHATSTIISRNSVTGGDSSSVDDPRSKFLYTSFSFRPQFHLPSQGGYIELHVSKVAPLDSCNMMVPNFKQAHFFSDPN